MAIDRCSDNQTAPGRTSRRRFTAGAAALFAGAAMPRTTAAQVATPTPSAASPGTAPAADQATFDATFSHHTATIGDVRLHYVVGGQGDPVTLLHGWPQTWYEWRRVMPALAARHTVIAPDLRGLGDSAKPLAGYDARTVAADIHGLVRQLGHSRVFLVGHDIGGWVAMAYAAAHRDEVRRLAILETFPADDLAVQFTTLNPQNPRQSLWHVSFHAVRDLPEALIAGRERLYLSHFYRGGAYNPVAVDEAAIDEYARCYAAEGGMRAGFEYYRAISTNIQHTKEDAKTKLAMPFLALGGEFSFGPFIEQEWPKYATNVRTGVMPRSGHWIPEEQPALLAEQLLAFFGEG